MESWAFGFISAFNFYAPSSGGEVQRGTESVALTQWLTQYCREHPLDEMVKAVTELIGELERRARR